MKNLEQYLALPYTIVLRQDEEGDTVARVDEIPGCSAHGRTRQEALENLEEAQRLWIADALEAGDAVPEPRADDSLPSGKWVQRVPRSLHRKLVDSARREKVSLNQLVTSMLSEAVGQNQNTVVAEQPVAVRNLCGEFLPRSLGFADLWNNPGETRYLVFFGGAANTYPEASLGCRGVTGLVPIENSLVCMGGGANWSIQHEPAPADSLSEITVWLDHMKENLPNHFTRSVKDSLLTSFTGSLKSSHHAAKK